MAFRFLIGDRHGRVIAEAHPDVGPIPWRKNEIAKTTVRFSRNDPVVTARNFQEGNRVLIEFDTTLGLPTWGGTIEPPAIWTQDHIEITVYTIEYLLQYRRTDKTRAFISTLPAVIITSLLQETEYDQPLGIVTGQRIWTGGRMLSPHYHSKTLWWIIKDSLIAYENCDVRFVPKLVAGQIVFEVQIFESVGDDKSTKRGFKEGRNVGNIRFSKQGAIVNEFYAIGGGTTWGDERLTSTFREAASNATHGLRQASRIYSSVSQIATLDRYAQSEVEQHSLPHARIMFDAANTSPATFAQYDVGDVLGCVLPNYSYGGFSAPVRVLSREYIPREGKCRVLVEEERTVTPVYSGTGGEFIAND